MVRRPYSPEEISGSSNNFGKVQVTKVCERELADVQTDL